MNPNKSEDRYRLFRAMDQSYRTLKPFRDLTSGLVEEYAGTGYGKGGRRPRYEIIVNLMNQAVDAYTMALVANRPRVLLTTKHDTLKPFAKHFEVATNNLIQEIELEYTLRQWVLDAFFCLGVIKVHRADSAEVELEEGFWADPGTPFASNVSIDNWVHDVTATRWDKVLYAADCYRLPFSDLKNPDFFDQSVVKELKPTSKYAAQDDERLEFIASGREVDHDECEPMADLMDVWIPREGKIFTFPMDAKARFNGKHKPVADMEWDGPESGPYHLLAFNDVPENIMPTSPASHLSTLARLVNNLLRKGKQQALRQKEVTTYTAAGSSSAQKIKTANDGDMVQVDDPNDVRPLKFGGTDAATQALATSLIAMFDRMAGNLTAMLGLGAQADTVGQEQLIHSAASRKEAQMQYRVVEGTRRLIRDLGWMLWNDKVKTLSGKLSIEGAEGYAVEANWTPEDREGSFFDYNFDIDVFSMPYTSPQQRLQAVHQLVTSVFIPGAQLLMAQGGSVDMQRLTEIYADLMNEPRLREIIKFTAPAMGGGTEEGPSMPSSTTRSYVRKSVPTQGSPQGQSVQQQQGWMSMAQQQAGRPEGGA